MADLNIALITLFKQEGLFSDDKNDPGGATNYGISLRWLKSISAIDDHGILTGDLNHDGFVNVADIRSLTKQAAADLYKKYWWNQFGYGIITDQFIANKILSASVNMGGEQAARIAQRAVWSILDYKKIDDDGVLGPKSFSMINVCPAAQLLSAIKSEMAAIYRMIIAHNPNSQEYANGWFNRAYS